MSARDCWRLIEHENYEPLCNLTREEAIARSNPSAPILRLWRNSPCVVLGRFQLLAAEVDRGVCESERIPVYRRFTGGGAVYHDLGNLNISLYLPRKAGPLVGDSGLARLPNAYSLVLKPLNDALRMMGIVSVVGTRDITVDGSKVSGAAAWFGAESILIHATLLVDANLELLQRTLNGPGAAGDSRWERTKSQRAPVTSLKRQGFCRVPLETTREVLTTAFAGHFNCVLESTDLTTREQELAEELYTTKYCLADWHTVG